MEKKNNNSLIIVLIIIILILITIIGLFLTGVIKINTPNENNNNENTALEETKQVDTGKLQSFINNYTNSFTSIFLVNGNWEYDDENESKLTVNKNTNYLEKEEHKQLFVMENISKDENNTKNFIIFDSLGNIDKDETCVRCEASSAYYPYNLFNIEFKKVFNRDFDMSKKATSEYSKVPKDDDSSIDYSKAEIIKYENSNDYVYNNYPDTGGAYDIQNIQVISSSYDNQTKKYTANLNLIYSDRLKGLCGVDSNSAKLVYTIVNDNIILESFTVE